MRYQGKINKGLLKPKQIKNKKF